MNEIIKKECMEVLAGGVKNADIKISLEGWPCTVASLGVCATIVALAIINSDSHQGKATENDSKVA